MNVMTVLDIVCIVALIATGIWFLYSFIQLLRDGKEDKKR